MKHIKTSLAFIISLLVVFTSCEKEPFIIINTPQEITFSEQGGSQSISFTANRNWSVSSTESWVKVSPSSGASSDGSITVTLTCEQNTTYSARSATITVNVENLRETITVSQDLNLGIIVSPKTIEVSNKAQSIEVEVKANVGYSIEIDAACKNWISLAGTKSLSAEKITFNIVANEAYDPREGIIIIKQSNGSLSETITVKQGQTDEILVSTSSYELSNEEHQLSIEVKANVEYTVTSDVDWIQVVSTKALSSSTLTLGIEKNESYDNRTGHVVIQQKNGEKSATITIEQGQALGLIVSPNSFDLSKEAQTIKFTVSYNVDFDIIVPDGDKNWLTVKEDPSTKALSEKTITIDVAENANYSSRETSVTLKQKGGSLSTTVKILQAQTDILSVEKSEYDVDVAGGDIVVNLNANVSYSVDFSSDVASWISLKSQEEKALTFSIAPCNFDTDRTGVVYLKGASLQQSITFHQFSPNAGKAIEFKSSVVKKVCVENYDLNGDGELSYGEAAKVTVIHSQFFGDYAGGITSFDELQYFTAVSDIRSYAFYNCKYLKSIILPEFVTTIGAYAFANDFELSSITLPNGIVSIGKYAFANCSKADLNIPKACSYIGESAFTNSGITRAIFPEGLEEIQNRTLENCSKLSEVSLPSTVRRIGLIAFGACPLLESIVLPEGLTYLGESAFYASGLKSINISGELVSIPGSCFSQSLLEEITIPQNIVTVGEYAFSGCFNLKKVVIENADIILYDNPFASSYSIESFEGALASADKRYLSQDNVLIAIATGNLTEYAIPEGIEVIGVSAAESAQQLQKISFPSSVKEIRGYAFVDCQALSDISFSEGLKVIGQSSFSDCRKVKTVTIPDSVETIGSNAFWGLSMDKLTIGKSCKEVGENLNAWSFEVNVKECYMRCLVPPTSCPYNIEKIYVPTGTIEAYKSSSWNTKYTTSVEEYNITD